MKMKQKKYDIVFEPDTMMDMFWLGIIISKNKCHEQWENGVIKNLTISKENVITGLSCKRY